MNNIINRVDFVPYAFQPIKNIQTGSLPTYGYEALVRPVGKTPMEYIEEMVKQGRSYDLEISTFYNAITQFVQRGYSGKLFINSLPYEMLHKEDLDILISIGKEKSVDIVIENLEYGDKADLEKLKEKIEFFKEKALSVALDDFGTGINSIEALKVVKPDIVKVDRFFISGCTKNATCRNTVEIFTEAVKKNGAKVLAEGIETIEEFRFCQDIGIEYGQGFYLGLPE